MSLNIFQIWDSIGRKAPFAVRRENWNPDYYTIVERIECEALPYGKAFGYPTIAGHYTTHYEYDKHWRKDKIIPCCGCYQWALVEDADFSKYKAGIQATIKTVKGAYVLNSIFRYGKYKEMDVGTVFLADPGYIEWAINNIDKFSLTKESFDFLDNRYTNFKFREETRNTNEQKLSSLLSGK